MLDQTRDFFTTSEAAQQLGVNASTVRRWVYKGKLPGWYLNTQIIVRKDAVEAMAEARK